MMWLSSSSRCPLSRLASGYQSLRALLPEPGTGMKRGSLRNGACRRVGSMIPAASGRVDLTAKRTSDASTLIVGMQSRSRSWCACWLSLAEGETRRGGWNPALDVFLSLAMTADIPGRLDHQCVRPLLAAVRSFLR